MLKILETPDLKGNTHITMLCLYNDRSAVDEHLAAKVDDPISGWEMAAS